MINLELRVTRDSYENLLTPALKLIPKEFTIEINKNTKQKGF